jgi:hypothetical protein
MTDCITACESLVTVNLFSVELFVHALSDFRFSSHPISISAPCQVGIGGVLCTISLPVLPIEISFLAWYSQSAFLR